MKYIWIGENGVKLIPTREKLNQVINKTPDDVSFTVTPWHEGTPAKLMSNVACHIIGDEAATLVGLKCLATNEPLEEALWSVFEKKLSNGESKGNFSRSY